MRIADILDSADFVKPCGAQKSSAILREKLGIKQEKVLLAFSRGKDSIAAWLALRDAGVEVIPYHMNPIPGAKFISESLAYFEDFFGQKIYDYPHPNFYNNFFGLAFQPPYRHKILQACEFPGVSFKDTEDLLREEHGLSSRAWVCDGVRAADSPIRRLVMTKHGVMRSQTGHFSCIYDWRKQAVVKVMEAYNVQLPKEYELFGRSYDGYDYRFIKPLKDHMPEDYKILKHWFPLIDVEIARHEL